MSLAGLGVVCIWQDLLPEARDEFPQWHNREHMPERVGSPGLQMCEPRRRDATKPLSP